MQKERANTHQTASQTCLPLGPLNSVGTIEQEIKIVQTPNLMVILYGDLTYRQVFFDGRILEKDPNPTWMGYAVGRWEGDTLVVASNGYNDRTWLDTEGHPHSEGLRITERFRRTDFGHIDLHVTFEDPAVYARPIQMDTTMQAVADTEMLENVCAENEKDRAHMTGNASEDPTVELSAKELSEFVGTYTAPNPFGLELKFDVNSAGRLVLPNGYQTAGTVVQLLPSNSESDPLLFTSGANIQERGFKVEPLLIDWSRTA